MTSRHTESDQKDDSRAGQNRRALLTFLRSDHPAWLDRDHPELAAGSASWVRSLRRESDRCLKP